MPASGWLRRAGKRPENQWNRSERRREEIPGTSASPQSRESTYSETQASNCPRGADQNRTGGMALSASRAEYPPLRRALRRAAWRWLKADAALQASAARVVVRAGVSRSSVGGGRVLATGRSGLAINDGSCSRTWAPTTVRRCGSGPSLPPVRPTCHGTSSVAGRSVSTIARARWAAASTPTLRTHGTERRRSGGRG